MMLVAWDGSSGDGEKYIDLKDIQDVEMKELGNLLDVGADGEGRVIMTLRFKEQDGE